MIRVSIVEDNLVTRNNLAKFIQLHPEEFELGAVHESAHVFLGSSIIHPGDQVHVLLLDIGLPGISGTDAIPLILEKLPDINVVMLTTYEEEDVILKSICNGACSYISKRATLDEIAAAIRVVATGGSYMSPSIAREIVTHLMGGKVSKATILSDRQREILQLLVDGKSYQHIATSLFLSVETVRTHIKKMYKTIQVNNRVEAIAKYMRGQIR